MMFKAETHAIVYIPPFGLVPTFDDVMGVHPCSVTTFYLAAIAGTFLDGFSPLDVKVFPFQWLPLPIQDFHKYCR